MEYKNNSTQDWSELAEGTHVAITEPSNARYSATVDTKTDDSTVIWVIDSWGQRRAFDHREGIRLDILHDSNVTG